MSVQTTVEELASELGDAIVELPEYEAFESAKAAVEDDEEAQRLIDEFERERQEFVMARHSGDATRSDLQSLQSKQQQLHDVPIMSEYLEAQEALQDRLEAVNEAVSEPLALDFGETAGGCCQD